MLTRLAWIATFLLAGVAAAAEPAADLFVSPAGNDTWSGKLAEPNPGHIDGPLATLEAARLRVRDLRKAQPDRKTPIVVRLRGGTYPLSQPVTFTPDDRGSLISPTRYEAFAGESPLLSGGTAITGWRVQPDGRWVVVLDDVKQGKWDFSQLFVNGERRMRPRLPKQGYFHVAERVPPPPAADKTKTADDRFRYAGDDINATWKNRGDVEVVTFHPWFTSMLRIADVDAANHVVAFTGHTAGADAWGQLTPGMRYLVDNVAEALDEPGEWYLDRPSGTLTYIPKAGERPETATVIAPRIGQLVLLQADQKADAPHVEYLEFHGLTFAHSNWTTPKEGSSISQAAVTVNAMVAAVGASHVVFENCTFTRGGNYGLDVGAGCSEIGVAGCRFVDLGGGGVKVGTTAVPSGAGGLTHHVVLRDNLIAHLGRNHPAAVGVWVGNAADVAVEHNDIYDLYYTGVSAGWVWGYGKTACANVRIAYNDIHHLGQGVLSDMGGIYTLGASPRSVLEFNRIHDVERDKYGGWGVYYDEGSAGYTSRNNLLYRLHDGGFHQHYGADNVFENNVLVDSRDVQWGPTRIDTPTSPGKVVQRRAITFERNIVDGWAAASVVRAETMGKLIQDHTDKLKVDHNVYWNRGKDVKFGDISFEKWQERGLDKKSIVADPKLPKDVDRPDFRVPENSPAVKLGFKPFDISGAGRSNHEPADLDEDRWPRAFPHPSTSKRAERKK